jgi:hypothetical protein
MALHIIELVKSLPVEEQRAVCETLAKHGGSLAKLPRRRLQRLPDGRYVNPDGIPNDDPVFKIVDAIEADRHRTPGPPPPEFS